MGDISSESKFIWKIIWLVLITPITIVLVIFNKKNFEDVFAPITELFKFIFEAKFTIIIIILNVTIYIWSLFFPEELFNSLIHLPGNIFSSNIYSLITSGFLHANLTHLLSNMVALFIFGRVVEKNIGSIKTSLVYFGALIISGIFFSLIHLFIIGDNVGGIGASGALMGLIATAILLDPFYLTYELIVPLPIMFIGWIAIFADIIGVLNPVEDGIGHFAHIGGFISIGLLMYLLGIEEREKIWKGLVINLISLMIASGLIYLYLNGIIG